MAREISRQMEHIEETIHRLNIQQSDDSSELTEQYGYLKFDDNDLDSDTRLSQYIRLALHTDARTVVEFMQHGWNLPVPDLIISITGGGKQCQMSTHLRKTFQRGLVIAAATTNAWLITAGTNTGVVKEVGEAICHYRYKTRKHGLDVPCIGICTWEYIAGTEQLEKPNSKESINVDNDLDKSTEFRKARRPSRASSNPLDAIVARYVRCYVVKQSDMKQCDLEPNHTHFLLFDGQSTNNNAVLLQRANIEKYSCHTDITVAKGETPIPIVMILLEGGPFSADTICHALRSNTPLVVVKGSGRAADLVADLHIFFSRTEKEKTKIRHSPSQSRQVQLEEIFEKHRPNTKEWIDQVKTDLCQVLSQRKELVVIFEFDSPRHHGNLEDAILEALFNAAKYSGDYADEQQCLVAELKLAMAWEKFDYAKKYILTDSTISKWAEIDLCHALVGALRRGYIDFIDLLLDYGVSLDKLTWKDLDELYASQDSHSGLPVGKTDKNDLPTRNDYYSVYFPHRTNLHWIITNKNLPLGVHAGNELFLWSIFRDRFELAKYLCSKTWNQSVAPLIAVQLYRQAIKMALHTETKQQYDANAREFDKHAMSIIDQCFDHDEYFAVQLLKQPAITFDNVERLKLAERADCQAFLASECVKTYLDQEWFGHLNYKRKIIHLRIFLCALFLPLLPFFCIFLPYVHKHRQVSHSEQNHSKIRSPVMIQTVIKSSDRDSTDSSVSWSKKIEFFYRAPIVRFWYYVIFDILFLGLFSFVVLFDFLPYNIYIEQHKLPITEIILHICLWTLIFEEFCQIILRIREDVEWDEYLSNIWKVIDLMAIVFYLIAFITRFIQKEDFFIVAKVFLCFDLIIWFVRTLHLFSAFERLGPKLVMIFNTMKDLFFFICFILIFLCGFSITSWSLIKSSSQFHWIYDHQGRLVNVTIQLTKNQSLTWQTLRDITHHGVWKIFGQVDPIEGDDAYSNIAFILTIIFVAIANILLLNVLIALFNVTIQNVQEQSHDIWRYQRFFIVNEFRKKPTFPPPFNVFYYLFVLVRYLFRRIQIYRQRKRFVASEMLLGDIQIGNKNLQQQFRITDQMRREKAIVEDYWKSIFNQKTDQPVEVTLQNIEKKIDHIRPNLQDNKKTNIVNYQSDKQINIESDV